MMARIPLRQLRLRPSRSWRNGFTPNGFTPNGFTLVEMLVAVMLLGILAAIASAMSIGAARGFAVTNGALSHLGEVETTRLALLSDLGQAARRPSIGAEGKRLNAFTLTKEGFVLVRYLAAGEHPAVEKIAWGFDGQQLLRQPFHAVDGAAPGRARPMLHGVRALALRVADDGGWRAGWRPEKATDLPRALELTLVLQDGQRVVMKFAVAS